MSVEEFALADLQFRLLSAGLREQRAKTEDPTRDVFDLYRSRSAELVCRTAS
jgi:hypothetical protein